MANNRKEPGHPDQSEAHRARSIEWDLFSKRIFIRARNDPVAHSDTVYMAATDLFIKSDPTPLTRRSHPYTG